MKIAHEFEVSKPPETIWSFFQDVPAVADCLPGAELLEDKGDGMYAGKVSVKLGPMTATFEGEATVTPDHEAMKGTIEGRGVDKRGGSRGQVKVEYAVSEGVEGTQVHIDADVVLSGAAAQFGRTGLIREMSTRLIDEFVYCVESKLGAETEEDAKEVRAGEVRGFSLFLQSLVSWFKGLFRRAGS